MRAWYLEGYSTDGSLRNKQAINSSPFVVGRAADSAFVIASDDVSRHHAEFELHAGGLLLRDLGSTNGTFVNHRRIDGEERLAHGDVVHFANMEYRVVAQAEEMRKPNPMDVTEQTVMFLGNLSNQLPVGNRALGVMINNAQVTPFYQPIVSPDGAVKAFEVLGRGNHPDLPKSPGPLFSLAESVGEAVTLSELFRDQGVATAAGQTPHPLFMNIHPDELKDEARLVASLEALRDAHPEQPLTLEIHEKAATDLQFMRRLIQHLERLRIDLAYDDFGAGQARLLELVEVPPSYVKFDIAMVRGIANASQQKLQMLSVMVNLCHQLGIQSLAEGIEESADAKVCEALGFSLIQGFVYSKPKQWHEVEKHRVG